MTLTARHRVSRRGICELARDLFGVSLSTGSADAICQRASDALAGPHLQLQDWVLDQGAVHVDETGWRTRGEGRALWTATTPAAAVFLIAEHCNREQFNALIGTTYPGIVISDRWNGYSHLDPGQRQVCWSHLQRDFRRHADGLGEQKTFGEKGFPLTKQVFAAWRSYQHEHHDRERLQAEIAPIQTELRQLLQNASPKKARNRWHRQFANNLLKVWPALWTFTRIDGIEPTNNPAERALRGPVIHRKLSLGTQSRQRRTLRRTRALRRHNLPHATPLAVHLPQRTHRRTHPRRPIPRAHLSRPRGLNAYVGRRRSGRHGFPSVVSRKPVRLSTLRCAVALPKAPIGGVRFAVSAIGLPHGLLYNRLGRGCAFDQSDNGDQRGFRTFAANKGDDWRGWPATGERRWHTDDPR